MTDVVILRCADREWRRAIRWYRRQNKAAAGRFVQRVTETLAAISKDPTLGQRAYTEYRFWRVPKFPYLIYYSIEPRQVTVVAICHGRRRPMHWLRCGNN